MPCYAAINKNSLTVKETDIIEDVLKLMREKGQDIVAVENEDGEFEGLFGLQTLMRNALPVSISMGDDFYGDINVPAAPGIAKRLEKILPLSVSGFVNRKVHVLAPDVPIWQGVSMLVKYGEPMVILDQESKKFIGFMSYQSAFDEIERLKNSES